MTISENRIRDVEEVGIEVRLDTRDLRIRHNRIIDASSFATHGISLFTEPGKGLRGFPLVANNTIRDLTGNGIIAQTGRVVENDIQVENPSKFFDNKAVALGGDEERTPQVHRNNFAGTADVGLAVLDGHANATDNWWGCPGGPPSEECPPVEGNVTFRPWAEEPFATAGAES